MADISIARLSAVLPATELVPVLQNEIDRLRLTDAEREAIEMAADDNRYHQEPGGRAAHIERTLRGLLERTK